MNKLGLYIHIPFCRSKCLYCDFPSYPCMEDYMVPYVKALCIEIEETAKNKEFSSAFIGGGTPSYLSVEALQILSRTLKKIKRTSNFEFTIECNPNSFNEEKLKIFKDMGVNRLSIGLQACQNRLLKKLGRIHSLEDFTYGFKLARELGFENINVDLMFGIPEQSVEDFRETLKYIVSLKSEHISAYSLIVEKGTPYYKMNEQGKLKLPGEEAERQMYILARDFLKKCGYNQYEISNFSLHGKECRHNIIYWELNDYIGCGASAHSYFHGLRYRNEDNVREYIKKKLNCESVVVERHLNSLKDNMEEFMFLGLRKIRGVSVEEFKKRFNININDIYGNVIKKYTDNKMLIFRENRLFLSEYGIQVSNSIMCDFIL